MNSNMVVRIPDGDGVPVTYEAGGVLGRQLGTGSLATWAKAGAVRRIIRRNVHYYAVLDAAMLKALTPAESLALGIRRIPDEYIARQRAWDEKSQARTEPKAEHAGEVWDDYDRVYVLDAYNAGAKVEEIATALGRTYQSITATLSTLRESGDLPKRGRGEPGWQWKVLALLTAEERATFLAAKARATLASRTEVAAA